MQPAMQGFVGIEAEAQEIRIYHPAVVHGLLQTEDYSKAIFDSKNAAGATLLVPTTVWTDFVGMLRSGAATG